MVEMYPYPIENPTIEEPALAFYEVNSSHLFFACSHQLSSLGQRGQSSFISLRKIFRNRFDQKSISHRLLLVFFSLLVARGKWLVPKAVPVVIITVLILAMIAAALAMGYFISYPRSESLYRSLDMQ